MNIADLTKKHGNVNFSSFDEAKKSDGDNVRWVRSDHASFHIRNGGELWHYASSIEEVDNILSNMELLKSWTETVLKELKSIKQVKAVVTSGYYITSYVVLVSIKSIGFEARVELDKALDGSLCVLLAPEQKYRKTTLNDLNKTIAECASNHVEIAKKTYEESVEMLLSIQEDLTRLGDCGTL